MSENVTKNGQEVLVCHVEGLEAYRAGKTPVSKIPSDLPQWKQELLKKKEKEKMEKHREEMARLYEDSQTPEWMKPLKKLHQRRKSEQSEKEEAERRKAEEEKQRFEALPAWKKQLIFKKRAKSADNLLAGCDVKSLDKSETKELEIVNSECKAKEKIENGEVNLESDAGTNGVDDGNENGISDNEKLDYETSIDEIEKEGEHDEENEEVEDTGDDSEQAVDFDKNEGEEIEIAQKIDEVDGDQKVNISEEIEDHDDELQIESSDNSSEGELSPAVPNDNEDESQLLEPDEDEAKETGEQQVEESGEPEEVENNNEDKNRE
ncbi:Hypothetical predicted protein [Paramuricea clavata]|uniref:Uncharacterized protein n=1 Tax=Paramuricea clavata TaxID=317549 RepID=A0A6S7JY66_PARCT|nr:Hypothetical predicted protein [Paramuricea clavata]